MRIVQFCNSGSERRVGLVGDQPDEVRDTSRVMRDGSVLWEEEFLSGEKHTSHSIANLSIVISAIPCSAGRGICMPISSARP